MKFSTVCSVPLHTSSYSLVADNLTTDVLRSPSSYIALVTITSKASPQIYPTLIPIHLCKVKHKFIISTIYELLEIWLSNYSAYFGGNTCY